MSAAPDVTVILPTIPPAVPATQVWHEAFTEPIPTAQNSPTPAEPAEFFDQLMAELRPSAFQPEWVEWQPWWPEVAS